MILMISIALSPLYIFVQQCQYFLTIVRAKEVNLDHPDLHHSFSIRKPDAFSYIFFVNFHFLMFPLFPYQLFLFDCNES